MVRSKCYSAVNNVSHCGAESTGPKLHHHSGLHGSFGQPGSFAAQCLCLFHMLSSLKPTTEAETGSTGATLSIRLHHPSHCTLHHHPHPRSTPPLPTTYPHYLKWVETWGRRPRVSRYPWLSVSIYPLMSESTLRTVYPERRQGLKTHPTAPLSLSYYPFIVEWIFCGNIPPCMYGYAML